VVAELESHHSNNYGDLDKVRASWYSEHIHEGYGTFQSYCLSRGTQNILYIKIAGTNVNNVNTIRC